MIAILLILMMLTQIQVPASPYEVAVYSYEYAWELKEQFNSRYGFNVSMPDIEFSNRTEYDFFTETIRLEGIGDYWKKENDTYTFYARFLRQSIAHEFCHHTQHEISVFPKNGESFCDLSAGINRTKGECEELKILYYYCTPYRSEVFTDKQGFIDCVWESSEDTITKEELDSCYHNYDM